MQEIDVLVWTQESSISAQIFPLSLILDREDRYVLLLMTT